MVSSAKARIVVWLWVFLGIRSGLKKAPRQAACQGDIKITTGKIQKLLPPLRLISIVGLKFWISQR
jgi:hypothetical protein